MAQAACSPVNGRDRQEPVPRTQALRIVGRVYAISDSGTSATCDDFAAAESNPTAKISVNAPDKPAAIPYAMPSWSADAVQTNPTRSVQTNNPEPLINSSNPWALAQMWWVASRFTN